MGVRHLQCFFLFTAISACYAMRVNLYVAILAMTDKKYSNPDYTEYNWSEQSKSMVLSSFYWGYSITQIPGGLLAVAYGGKVVLCGGVLLSSIMALILPICADIGGWKLVCCVRVMDGLSQGVIFPSSYAILCNWCPADERGVLGTFCFSGIQVGTFVMTISSGFLAASPLGWPFVFYLSGSLGVTWVLCFLILGASSPSECKYISDKEKNYIDASLAKIACDKKSRQFLRTPWRKLASSVPFLAVIFTQCSNTWGLVTLNMEIPSYFKNVLRLDIKRNGTLAALPWLAMLILCIIFGNAATLMEKHFKIKRWTIRRIFNTIGEWIPMMTLLAVGFVGEVNPILAIALITITVGCNAGIFVSFTLSHMDLSPNYAGTLMGIGNTFGNLMGLFAPLFVGAFVTDLKNPDQWRLVFFFASGYYFLGNLLYLIFGTADVQPWNDSGVPASSQE